MFTDDPAVVDMSDPAYAEILDLWSLRLLVHGGGLGRIAADMARYSETVGALLGMTPQRLERSSAAQLRTVALRRLKAMERRSILPPAGTAIAVNVALLGRSVGLNAVEQEILHLALMARMHEPLSSLLSARGTLSLQMLITLLSSVLSRPMADVRRALDAASALSSAALLVVDRNSFYEFNSKLDLLDGMLEEVCMHQDDIFGLLRNHLRRPDPGSLSLGDYPHLSLPLESLMPYLAGVLKRRTRGANVLLYGVPGTGKTELVRAVAASIGADLVEVATSSVGGNPIRGDRRFRTYRMAQAMLRGSAAHMILFDEVEDVFEDKGERRDGEIGNASGIKGWVNTLLETNPVPAFWVTNRIDAIDPAYRRRFDVVLHVEVPPVEVRRSIVRNHTRDVPVDDGWRDVVAHHPKLTPAIVSRAVRVYSLMDDDQPRPEASATLTRLMNGTLQLMGYKRLEPQSAQLPIDYRLDALSANADLQSVCDGLGRVGSGRLLLYGPPGTGKTAYARHVARVLDRPVMVRRASDILAPLVGVSEQLIAKMFEEAADSGAVLCLDEADSLLQERRSARNSWEVTLVNEMLTQMESFEGIFLASTNLVSNLDEAATRRFDMQVQFGYLRAEAASSMFQMLAGSYGLAVDDLVAASVKRLDMLTPGDFAAVWRAGRLAAPRCAAELLERLRRMCACKKDRPVRAIGFAA